MTSTAANGSVICLATSFSTSGGGSPAPAQNSSPSASTTTTRGRPGPAPGDRLRRVGHSGPSSRMPRSPVVVRRRSRPSAPSRRSRPARRRRCRGARRPCLPLPLAHPGRQRPARGPGRDRPAPNACGSSSAIRSGPSAASTRQSGPPCSHSSCRHRPHGISGLTGTVHTGHATSRPPPLACSAETMPHSAHSPTPYEAFSTLQPTTTRPSSTRPATPTGNAEYGA